MLTTTSVLQSMLRSCSMIHPNLHSSGDEATMPAYSPQTLLSVLQPLAHLSVCLGICELKGNGGWMWRGKDALGGSVRGGEVPLWGTGTIIKDSTAASSWFACLIICHMLRSTATSHIRAWKLQQTSLRLDQSVYVPVRACLLIFPL